MTEPTRRTKGGKKLSDADIERLADEAEPDYDVDELIARRGSGGARRWDPDPRRSSQCDSIQSCAMRLRLALKRRARRPPRSSGKPCATTSKRDDHQDLAGSDREGPAVHGVVQ